jgi:hypothetical protein
MSNWKLDQNSQRVNQPTNFKGKLYDHQQAMLKRALDIEKTSSQFGFLADLPGAGKTNIIISLVMTDLQMGFVDRQTLLVVPQNILAQWKEQFEIFAGSSVSVKELCYTDILNIESHGSLISLREHNVLITTSDLFESIMSSTSSNGCTLHRIVFDEIDTIEEQLSSMEIKKVAINKAKAQLIENNKRRSENTKEPVNFIPPTIDKGLKNKISWIISASIFNMIDPKDGFYFLGKQITNAELPNLFVKCNSQFISDSLPQIEDEQEEIYECDCIADTYSHLLSGNQLDSINSISYDNVKLKNRKRVPSTELDLLKMLVKEYYTEMEDTLEAIEDIKRIMKVKNIDAVTDHPLTKQIEKKQKDYTFAKTLADEFHKVKCDLDCKDKETCTFNAFETIAKKINRNIKLSIISDTLIECKKDHKKCQILIFSDFQGSFKYLPELIEKLGLKYEDLIKGTSKGINNSIIKYKKGDTDILFIEAATQGCGLNLENTTHLIFIHRTDARLRDQIVGRAQRHGRVGQLKVISLYNKNENIDESESS